MSEPEIAPSADPIGTPDPRTGDFPFYNGMPVKISGPQWLFVMAAVVIGFAALIAPVPFFASEFGQFVPAILFFAIPLTALAIVAPKHWTAIFRSVRRQDILWMILFAILNLIVTLAVGVLYSRLAGTNANPAVAGLEALTASGKILFFLKTLPQLLGEEVLTILPFLAFMYLLFGFLKLSRKASIVLAWLACAILFAAVHLPTYGWNFIQCLLIIGSARLVLLLAYLTTKNIWVSTGAHIINDWTLFGFAILMMSLSRA